MSLNTASRFSGWCRNILEYTWTAPLFDPIINQHPAAYRGNVVTGRLAPSDPLESAQHKERASHILTDQAHTFTHHFRDILRSSQQYPATRAWLCCWNLGSMLSQPWNRTNEIQSCHNGMSFNDGLCAKPCSLHRQCLSLYPAGFAFTCSTHESLPRQAAVFVTCSNFGVKVAVAKVTLHHKQEKSMMWWGRTHMESVSCCCWTHFKTFLETGVHAM